MVGLTGLGGGGVATPPRTVSLGVASLGASADVVGIVGVVVFGDGPAGAG